MRGAGEEYLISDLTRKNGRLAADWNATSMSARKTKAATSLRIVLCRCTYIRKREKRRNSLWASCQTEEHV